MIIDVSASGCRLIDQDNFRALKITSCSDLTGTMLDQALGELGRLSGPDEALVSPEKLRLLADRNAESAWEAQYLDMLNQARAAGWIDQATGWIRVHVEPIGLPASDMR